MKILRNIAGTALWFLDFFVLELTPRYVAMAIGLGFALGLIEPLTLHWFLLAATAFLLPVPLGVVGAVALPFHFLSGSLVPIFHVIGNTALQISWLQPLWTFFYHLPILPYTRFNNTVVFGETLVAVVTAALAVVLLWKFLKRRWAHLRWLRDRSPSWGSLTRTFIGKRYFGASSDARWIRWESLGLAFLGVTLGGIMLFQGLSSWALPRAESLLSFLYGAPVVIEAMKVNLWAPSVELSNVVLMRSNGQETLLHLEKLRLQLAWGPLFAKKFLVTDISLEGVHLGAPGQNRFSNEEQQVRLAEVSGSGGALANSMAGNLHKKLRDEFGPNPLRTVGEFGSQMELSRRLTPLIPTLPLVKEILSYEAPLLAAIATADKQTTDMLAKFPTNEWREEAELSRQTPELRAAFVQKHHDAVAELQNTSEQLNRDLSSRRETVKGMYDSIPLAVNQLKSQLHLPQIDQADASPTIFGPHIIHFLERLGHWVDRSRRLMPTSQARLVSQERGRGQSLHFGAAGQPPLFLLSRAEIRDGGAEKPGLGQVKGFIANVTSDPSHLGKPTQAEFEFEFPESAWKGGKAKLWIDHTGAVAEEKIEISIEDFPLSKWNVSATKPLGVLATGGQGRLQVEITFKGQEIAASGKLEARDFSVDVMGTDREVTEAVRERLAKTSSFTLRGEVKGPLDSPAFAVHSEWGVTLQDALRRAYQTPIAALDDAIRQLLLDEIDPPLRKLETQLNSELRHITQRLGSLVDALRQIHEKTEPSPRSLSSVKKKK